LPNFIGRYFPSREDPDQYAFYCASMLLLLKPWHDIASDLKTPSQTWESALQMFLTQAPPEVHRIISGVQYFHQCERSAQDRKMQEAGTHAQGLMDECSEDID
ncbi:hypothetical protein EDD16DRAFT_1496358, partial [Pisolithus croceorrhizus]